MELPKIESIAEIAKKVLVGKGSHSPQAIIFNIRTHQAAPIVFSGLDSDKIVPALRYYVSKYDADMYFFINEAWMRMNVDPTKPFIRASLATDRKEVLIITEFHRSMAGNKWMIIPFHREEGKIVFEEPLPTNQFTELVSHFNVYLETEGIHEKIDRAFNPVRPLSSKKKGGKRK